MSQKKYDYVFFIGRFQPLHNGHIQVIESALKLTNNLIMLIGSSNVSRSIRNPFTFLERKQMIEDSFDSNTFKAILPLNDYPYNDTKWIVDVTTAINSITKGNNDNVALIGHTKSDTAYYLSLFPSFSYEEVPESLPISATDLREHYLNPKKTHQKFLELCTTDTVLSFLKNFDKEIYSNLVEEYAYVQKYKEDWKSAPYPPVFVTVDSVVIQSGHILLIERGGNPGKGLLALPGGFLDQNERMLDGAIRELREETCLKVPAPVLLGSLKEQYIFDAPNRSVRGRTVTQAFYFKLKDMPEGLPRVKGTDDARKASWYPLASLNPTEMFEDHYAIIQHFTNI